MFNVEAGLDLFNVLTVLPSRPGFAFEPISLLWYLDYHEDRHQINTAGGRGMEEEERWGL